MSRALAIAFAVVAAALAVPAGRHLRQAPPPVPPLVRADLELPPGVDLGAGEEVLDAALSPDGTEIVFVGTAQGRVQLWRRAFAADRATALAGTDGASMPAWKATGHVVSFFADGRLKQIALATGTVTGLALAPSPAGASWMPDGSLLFVPDARGPVRRMRDGAVSDSTRLAPGQRSHAFPVATDAGGFLYVATGASGARTVRYAIDGEDAELTTTSGHAELRDGVLVHVRDGVLLAQAFSAERRVLTGRGVPLAFDVGVSASGRAWFTASPRLLVWAAALTRGRDLAWYGADGRRLEAVAEPREYWQVRLSPDDREAAVTMLDPLLRTLDVIVLPIDGPGSPARLSLSLGADSDPVWSPDGQRVLYRSLQKGQINLFARRVRLADAPEESILQSDLDETASDWRGDTVLFHAPGPETGLDLWTLDLVSGARARLTRGAFNEWDARWSPDGRWIAYTSDESGHAEVYVETWPRGTARARVSFAGGTRPSWGREPGAIVFIRGDQLLRAQVRRRGDTIDATTPVPFLAAPGLRDVATAHRSGRVLVLSAGARTDTARAGLIVNWRPAMTPDATGRR